MNVKRASCFFFVLSSVPASEEVGSVGDRVSAGSGSGGADCRSDLRHSHRQRTCRWILPRHHCESQSPAVIHTSNTLTWCVVVVAVVVYICSFLPLKRNISFCVFVPPAEFWSISGYCWNPPGGKPQTDGESVPLTYIS